MWLAELTGPQRNHLSVEYVSSRVKQSSFVPTFAGPPCTDAIFSSDFYSVVRSLLRCCEHSYTNVGPDSNFLLDDGHS